MLVQQVLKVPKELKGRQDLQEVKVPPELRVLKEHKGPLKGHKDHKEHKVQQVLKGLKVVYKGHKVI
jgi:hypothetical protein